MNRVVNNVLELIGQTPLVRLQKIEEKYGLQVKLLAKVESFNPGGSVKDRIAFQMIEAAERSGALKKGATLIEATSGNTGIGLALVAAVKGYPLIITLPDTMSVERRALLKAYGAQLVLTPGREGMKGAIAKANALQVNMPDSFIPSQFENEMNPFAHLSHTGVEIYEQTNGMVDMLVAGVGTGGTITGTATYLKSKKEVEVIAVEPRDSAVLSGNGPGPHTIQGIGAGFVPKTLDTSIYDSIAQVSNEEAFAQARELTTLEGLLVGISSGAATHAAIKEAQKERNIGKTIVVVLPDTGERYLSTPLFNEQG